MKKITTLVFVLFFAPTIYAVDSDGVRAPINIGPILCSLFKIACPTTDVENDGVVGKSDEDATGNQQRPRESQGHVIANDQLTWEESE